VIFCHLRHRASLLSSAPMIQHRWRCHEMSDRRHLQNPPKRSASMVSNGALAQSGNGSAPSPQPALQRPTPQPALQRRRSNLRQLLQSVPQQKGQRPPHLWTPRPKTLCRLSEPWNNQFAAGVCGCSIKCPPCAFTPWLGSCKAAQAVDVGLRLLVGDRWISPRRFMTAAAVSRRSRGCSARRTPISRMSCISLEGRHA
jgi:hypothetical protein